MTSFLTSIKYLHIKVKASGTLLIFFINLGKMTGFLQIINFLQGKKKYKKMS